MGTASDDLPSGSHHVCPRCGSAADGSAFCASCGLNLGKQQELPTADAFAARARERRWLEEQAGNGQEQRGPSAVVPAVTGEKDGQLGEHDREGATKPARRRTIALLVLVGAVGCAVVGTLILADDDEPSVAAGARSAPTQAGTSRIDAPTSAQAPERDSEFDRCLELFNSDPAAVASARGMKGEGEQYGDESISTFARVGVGEDGCIVSITTMYGPGQGGSSELWIQSDPESETLRRDPAPEEDPPFLLSEEAEKRMRPLDPTDAEIDANGKLRQSSE